MSIADLSALHWLALIERELLLFAGVFFLIGSADELLVDLVWLGMRLSGRARSTVIDRHAIEGRPLQGRAVVLIPTWQEEAVIGATVAHALRAWPQDDVRIHVGCYRNDRATAEAANRGAAGDPRVRVVIHAVDGPTTKGDCLNGLYADLVAAEQAQDVPLRMVLLHDAEDMVDAAALPALDQAIDQADFVQLPVVPLIDPVSRWTSAHYCEEFAESHAKSMVVRDALKLALPAAGVGCAIAFPMLRKLADERSTGGLPFAADCLTEDYEVGLMVEQLGGRSRFLRLRGRDGKLVATRAYFPNTIGQAVRQKTRWLHGIAFQGWDRMGWGRSPGDRWMRMRDRRGPLTALILAAAYLLLVLSAISWIAGWFVPVPAMSIAPALQAVIILNLASFLWRAAMRFAFTTREYGWLEGLRAVLRIPLANIIAIMAARRALGAYARSLAGGRVKWDKTRHQPHPSVVDHGIAT